MSFENMIGGDQGTNPNNVYQPKQSPPPQNKVGGGGSTTTRKGSVSNGGSTTRKGSVSNGGPDFDDLKAQLLDDMTNIIENYKIISNYLPKVGAKGDSHRLRDAINHALTQANKVIISSEPNIKKMKNYQNHRDKDVKNLAYKIIEDFNKLQENLKKLNIVANNRLEESNPPSNNGMQDNYDETTPLFSNQESHDNEQLLKKQQAYLQLENERDFQDAIIHERDEEIKVIQQQMREVNTIFQDISMLVNQQGEMMDNLLLNLSSGGNNVKAAVSSVEDAKKSQNKSRRRLCFLAIFLTVAAAIGVVVVILVFNKKE